MTDKLVRDQYDMNSAPVAIIILLLGISGYFIFLAAVTRERRRVVGASEITIFMICIAIYAASYAVELSRTDLAGMLMAIRMEYLGIPFLSLFWLLFAYRFTSGKKFPKPVLAILFFFPLLIIAAVWTNDFHHLYYIRTWVRTDAPFAILGIERGPFYYVHWVVMQLEILAGTLFLVRYSIVTEYQRRAQSVLMAVGAIVPWLGTLVYFAGLVPWNLDSSPFAAAISAGAFYLALFKLGLFEMIPAAREIAMDSLEDGFLVVDRQGRLIDANEASRRFLGGVELRIGDELPVVVPGVDELKKLVALGSGEVEYASRDPTGVDLRLSARAFPVRGFGEAVKGAAILIRDVTETAALLDRLRKFAETDTLTGLLNRRRFFELAELYIELSARENRPVTVMLADLDFFKNINDLYGHGVGDEVLSGSAEAIRSGLRNVDLVGRYGGEEFALLLPGAGLDGAMVTAERVRKEVQAFTLMHGGESVRVTVSIGSNSAIPGRGEHLSDFLHVADEALYEAKRNGRNRVVCRPGHNVSRSPEPRSPGSP